MSIFSGETLVAITGALGGGILVKLVDRRYQLREKNLDVVEARRKDVRLDFSTLKEELKLVRQEAENWKAKYYALFEENALLKASYKVVVEELSRMKESIATGQGSENSK